MFIAEYAFEEQDMDNNEQQEEMDINEQQSMNEQQANGGKL